LPWENFVPETRQSLENIIVSFKNTNRVINKGSNEFIKFTSTGNGLKKQKHKQNGGDLWAIRQPLHKETVHGKITLRQYKDVGLNTALKDHTNIADPGLRSAVRALLEKFEGDHKKLKKHLADNPLMQDGKPVNRVTVYYYDDFSAVRRTLDDSFDYKTIEKVSNSRIREILRQHLDDHHGDPKEAFSPEGIEAMNSFLEHPVHKVRVFESLGKKFALGERGNKNKKYVEAAKGTNMFFLIYENPETGERIINEKSSLALKDVIELKKNRLPLGEEIEGYSWFLLSPGDLVYMPEEGENTETMDWNTLSVEQKRRIYKMVSCTGGVCYFIPFSVSEIILPNVEFSIPNKTEKDIFDSRMIKQHCIKLDYDRLGNIKPSKYESEL